MFPLHSQGSEEAHKSSKIKVTILGSKWAPYRGGLSTLNRELAIQLAKYPDVEVAFLVPECSEDDKYAARSQNVKILEATHHVDFGELDWLSFRPENLETDIIVAHGVKHGRQAKVIRDLKKCKWIQVVHTVPELFSKGQDKHRAEEELCKRADYVVEVGHNQTESLTSHKIRRAFFNLMPGIFDEYMSIKPGSNETDQHRILLCGREGVEDMELQVRGFDIAAKAVAAVPNTWLLLVAAPDETQREIAELITSYDFPASRINVLDSFTSRERLFREVDLVIMPSGTEGFGLTALEALSAGVPVLVSRNSGFGKALSRVPFGEFFVVDSEDPNDWAARISSMWNKGRQNRLKEAEALREFYGGTYNWEKQMESFLDKMINLNLEDESHTKTESERKQKATAFSERHTELKSERKRHSGTLSDTQSSKQTRVGMFPGQESQQMGAMSQLHADVHCPTLIIERIRELYKRREGRLVPFPWWDEVSFNLVDIYTKLEIVSREKRRGTLTEEVANTTGTFRPHPEGKNNWTVLIEGTPGIGKTTYCQKLAYDWATGKKELDSSFPVFDVVLLLECRDITNSIRQAIDDQILPQDVDKETKDSFFKFIFADESKVLLILDGMDEANSDKPGMYQLLDGIEEFSACHMVITSRSEAKLEMRSYCDTLWEIAGFTAENAKRFIRKFFQGKEHLAEKLIEQLNSDSLSNLGALTKTPLFTAMLCGLFEDLEGALPTNGTQLHSEIVRFILRRYELKSGLSSSDEDLMSVYRRELLLLGSFALASLLKGELHFESPGEKILSFNYGFLSLELGGFKRRPYVRYVFVHKSFQEFFSGLFLAFGILNKEVDCSSVVDDEMYSNELRQVFIFMSGIIASQNEESAVSLVSSLARKINCLLRDPDSDVRSHMRLACDCISECSAFSKDLESRLIITLGNHLDMSTVSKLTLWNSGIHGAGALAISQALAVNFSLTYLDLRDNSIGEAGASSLSRALTKESSLTHLDLSNNSISDSGAFSLSQALRVNRSLNYLNLRNNSIGDDGANSFWNALEINTSLTSLDLSQNLISCSGTSPRSLLFAHSSLTTLNLSSNRIEEAGADCLVDALIENTSLKTLDLSMNRIGVDGACSLFPALRQNSSLLDLNLSENHIGGPDAGYILEFLRYSSLTKLDLSLNRIGDEGAFCLSRVLERNSSLISLNLRNNDIGDFGAFSLSSALKVNSSLTDLNLRSNRICDPLAVEGLLDLMSNNFGDRGASYLSHALQENYPSLTQLDLRDNPISDNGIAPLGAILKLKETASVHY